jgi:hypothetical protein
VSPSAAHKAAFGGVLAGVAAVVGMVFGVL